MSDFTYGLIGLGVLFVVVVWGVNKVQERRLRRAVEGRFDGQRADVLFGADAGASSSASGKGRQEAPARVEPTIGANSDAPAVDIDLTGIAATADASGEVDAVDDLRSHGAASASTSAAAAAAPVEVHVDEAIHGLILLHCETPVTGERLIAVLHGLRHAGRQPVQIVAALGDSGWLRIRPGERYDAVMVAVQLANRGGALNEIEFSEFVATVQHAAEQLPATCDIPDMIETIARARALDAHCAALDTQIGINLAHPQGRWSGEAIARQVEDFGLVLRPDGRFHALRRDGAEIYALQNGDGPAFRLDTLDQVSSARLTLLLDVPRAALAPSGHTTDATDANTVVPTPFQDMAAAAAHLAERLGAVLVDDNLRTLTPTALAGIERQIAPVYARLEEAGMPAGSARARALFN